MYRRMTRQRSALARENRPLWRATALQAHRGLSFVTAVSNKMSEIERVPPYSSSANFLVTGLFLLSLPTVAKGLMSQDAGSALCVPLSAFSSLSCSLSVRGQRESVSSTRRPSCHRLGNHWLLYPLVFAIVAQLMMGVKWYPAPTFKPATCAKSADNSVALLWKWHLTFLFRRPFGVLDVGAN